MGMDQKVTFAPECAPSWLQLAKNSPAAVPLQLRMIDGQLAFPEEEPPDAWNELRVGTPTGMVTLRREPDGIRLVIWGNADPAMRQAWNALTWAAANLSGGMVETGSAHFTADQFAQAVDLPGTSGAES